MTTTAAAPTTHREPVPTTTAAPTAVSEKVTRRALARPLILGAISGVILCLPIFTVG